MPGKRKVELASEEEDLDDSKVPKMDSELKGVKRAALESDGEFLSRRFKSVLASVSRTKKKVNRKGSNKDDLDENVANFDESFDDESSRYELDANRKKKIKLDLRKIEKQVRTTIEKKEKALQKEKAKMETLENAVMEMAKLRKEFEITIKGLEKKLEVETKEKEQLQAENDKIQIKNNELTKINDTFEESIQSKNKLIEKLVIDLHEKKDKDEKGPIQNYHQDRVKKEYPINRKIKYNVLHAARNRFFPSMSIEQMTDERLFQFMTSFDGLEFFQDRMIKLTEDEVNIVFEIVNFNPYFISQNKHGSVNLLRLFDILVEDQKRKFFKKLKPSLSKMMSSPIGHKVVLETFSKIPADIQEFVINEVSKDIIECCRNSFASLIVQRCIELGDIQSSLKLKQIILKVNEEAEMLCRHKYGSRVVQQILTTAPHELKGPLKTTVILMTPELIQHQYGNYVVQNLCRTGSEDDIRRVVDYCRGSVFIFARSKYASNVIQKILKVGSNQEDRKIIVEEISGKQELDMLVRDQYGNYVVQLIVDHGDFIFVRELYEKIIPGLDEDVIRSVQRLGSLLEEKVHSPGVFQLANKYVNSMRSLIKENKSEEAVDKIDKWMEDILNKREVTVDEKNISSFVKVLDDINGDELNRYLENINSIMKNHLVQLVAFQGKRQFNISDQQFDNSTQHQGHHYQQYEHQRQPQHTQLQPQHHQQQVIHHQQPHQTQISPNQSQNTHHQQPIQPQVIHYQQPHQPQVQHQPIPHRKQGYHQSATQHRQPPTQHLKQHPQHHQQTLQHQPPLQHQPMYQSQQHPYQQSSQDQQVVYQPVYQSQVVDAQGQPVIIQHQQSYNNQPQNQSGQMVVVNKQGYTTPRRK